MIQEGKRNGSGFSTKWNLMNGSSANEGAKKPGKSMERGHKKIRGMS